jgi:hypothetical protein
MTTTTTWTVPFADLLGQGSADARAENVATTAPAAPFQGTGVSFGAPLVGRRRGCPDAIERPIAPTYLPQHDGTTLGIHAPRRPRS